MKRKILIKGICLLVVCVLSNRVSAQSFGMEQNSDGSYTFNWANGTSITTNANGSYSASNGAGTCFNCVQTLPPVTVYGYVNTSTNTYTYTSYNYEGQYYTMPGYYASGYYGTPSTVIATSPTPAVAPPPVPSPCDGYSYSSSPGPGSLTSPEYASRLAELTTDMSANANEKLTFLGVNTPPLTPGLASTPVTTLGPTGGNGSLPNTPGFIPLTAVHTHPDGLYTMPSASDIYNLIENNAINSSFRTSYVISPVSSTGTGGTKMGLVVVNASKAAAFIQSHPKSSNMNSNGQWVGSLFNDFGNAVHSIDPVENPGSPTNIGAWEMAQAYVLEKYDTGIALIKADASGNFKQIVTVKTLDTNGNPVYSKYNCL